MSRGLGRLGDGVNRVVVGVDGGEWGGGEGGALAPKCWRVGVDCGHDDRGGDGVVDRLIGVRGLTAWNWGLVEA